MSLVRKLHVVQSESPEVGARVDRVVQQLCKRPRGDVAGLFDHGCVRVNDGLCMQPFQRMSAGDRVEVRYDPNQRYHVKKKSKSKLGFELLFEDRHLLIVNKPADLLTVPTPRGEPDTLLSRVSEYCRRTGHRRAWPVHRLDRGVSGLLVFGKSAEISQQIRDQFAMHKPEREYATIVAGNVAERAGTFESFLATDKALNRFSTDDEEIGQLAITHYEVAEHLKGATLCKVWLETGRRNQIRVHFSEAGHPVLGDPRYSVEIARHPLWKFRRIALHARRLGLEHPETGKPLRFESALPVEMEWFVKTNQMKKR
jgi:23S rRNA pseudouridine1911/1915/1917 synthase